MSLFSSDVQATGFKGPKPISGVKTADLERFKKQGSNQSRGNIIGPTTGGVSSFGAQDAPAVTQINQDQLNKLASIFQKRAKVIQDRSAQVGRTQLFLNR